MTKNETKLREALELVCLAVDNGIEKHLPIAMGKAARVLAEVAAEQADNVLPAATLEKLRTACGPAIAKLQGQAPVVSKFTVVLALPDYSRNDARDIAVRHVEAPNKDAAEIVAQEQCAGDTGIEADDLLPILVMAGHQERL